MSAHRVQDIKYSECWCLCTCGELIKSKSEAEMSADWKQHRDTFGLKTVNSWAEVPVPTGRPGYQMGIRRRWNDPT